jgi:hypothetical protein
VHVHADAAFGRRRARVTLTRHDGSSASTEQPFRNLEAGEAWARFVAACDRFGMPALARAVEGSAVRELIGLTDAAIA